MSSQTSLVAEQVRLQQWAAQIQDCKNRPADMKVETWCSEHGITKANYYYRLEKSPQSMFGGLQSRTGVCGTSSADRESSAPGRQQLKTDSYFAKFQRIGT